MNPPANIVALQDFMRMRFPEAHAFKPPTLDDPADEGARGVPMIAGSLTEVTGEVPSCGIALLMAQVIEGEPGRLRQTVALVDGADAFDPRGLPEQALARLLWVRCRSAAEALRATDLLLRDGNVTRVLLDLQFLAARDLRAIPANAWHRLRLLAEQSGAALCVFTAQSIVSCARVRMSVRADFDLHTLDDSREHALTRLRTRLTREAVLPRTASSAPRREVFIA